MSWGLMVRDARSRAPHHEATTSAGILGLRPADGLVRHPGMTALDSELPAGDAAIGFQITLAGGLDHAGGQRGRGRLAVPAAGAALGVEVIAQRLLVEARLRLSRAIGVRRPEPRTVRRHHLVDQDDATGLVPAEFEFGVGDDDAPTAGDPLAEAIDAPRHALELRRHRIADALAH